MTRAMSACTEQQKRGTQPVQQGSNQPRRMNGRGRRMVPSCRPRALCCVLSFLFLPFLFCFFPSFLPLPSLPFLPSSPCYLDIHTHSLLPSPLHRLTRLSPFLPPPSSTPLPVAALENPTHSRSRSRPRPKSTVLFMWCS